MDSFGADDIDLKISGGISITKKRCYSELEYSDNFYHMWLWLVKSKGVLIIHMLTFLGARTACTKCHDEYIYLFTS